MKKSKRKKPFLLWGFVTLLVFFTALSLLHLRTSFYRYQAGKERWEELSREKQGIEEELEKVQKRKHDSDSSGFIVQERLHKIEIVEAPSPTRKDEPFPEQGFRINIIEPE